MSDNKNKISFTNIWNILLEADSTLGLYLLKDPPKKLTFKEWIFKTTVVRNVFMYQGLLVTTLIITNFKLISVIFCILMLANFIALYTSLMNYWMNKNSTMYFLTWCEELYNVEKKFHPLVQKSAEIHLMSIERKTTKVLNLYRKLLYMNGFIINIGFFIFGMILPENILPKFTPPAPFYLPFKHQDNWTAYLVTISFQMITMFDSATVIIYVFMFLFTIIVHILGFLDLINETAERFCRDLKTSFETTEKSQSTLKTSVLEIINKSLDNKNNRVSFEDWIKILTDMISDVSAILSLLRKFYSMTFLSVEIASLSSLFICGLIITIIKQQYVFAFGIAMVPIPVLWIICFINEKILDKFDDIKTTLYDIPWYELEPKQAKTLLILLNCDEITKGFTVAGIHDLTIERFGIVIKAGYTNMLTLKDLIQK